MHQIGLIANPEKACWKANLIKAVGLIEAAHREAVSPQLFQNAENQDAENGFGRWADFIDLTEPTDLILVIGGDGTMLSVARTLRGSSTPILGINTGSLGFLTAAPMADLQSVLECIWRDDFQILSRPFIEAIVKGKNSKKTMIALNDFVIRRGEISRMIALNVSVDGDFLTAYQCDGLIVCSPTGSTAYSLSAGGPIISPDTSAMTLTPICPHALSNRSVIVPLESVIEVGFGRHSHEMILTADGQVPISLEPGEHIEFRKSTKDFRLLSVGNSSFFQTLRQKMKWSGSNV